MITATCSKTHQKPGPRSDDYWMNKALCLARLAARYGEVPVGAVVVCQDKLVGEGFNRMINSDDPSAHAEIVALREAGSTIGNYRLVDCTLYVTLEPCAMCSGAMIHSRIKRLVYGAADPRTGCAGSLMNLLEHPNLNHQVSVTAGILGEACSKELSAFFQNRRQQKKQARMAP